MRLAPASSRTYARDAVKYVSETHHRRSIRLPGWDYRLNGAYFVTICAHDRACLFDDRTMRTVIEQVWRHVTRRTFNCRGDGFVVMPNHVHGIIRLVGSDAVGRGTFQYQSSLLDRPHLMRRSGLPIGCVPRPYVLIWKWVLL